MIRRLRLWQDTVQTEVEITGDGPPIVYLHGPWGLPGDRPFIEQLGQYATVYAPRHPGTTPGDPDAIHRLESWHDLVVYSAELFDQLELPKPLAVVGHSTGGLLAGELAAALPGWIDRLVLIDPVGLWRDDLPVKNWMILSDEQRRRALFADPHGPAAERFFGAAQGAEQQADFIWAQACTGKFVWPLPDKGFGRRIHRVAAACLLIWGTADGIIAPAYADEFAARLPGARVERIPGAGHLPHLEQPEAVVALIRDFLAAAGGGDREPALRSAG